MTKMNYNVSMKALKLRGVVLLVLLSLGFGACKNDLVGETTLDYNEKKNAADYNDYILPPQTVTASSGNSRCVKLNWSPVENAVRYQIYAAETPFDPFQKVIETRNNETEIIIDEFAGITKYYTVCAVNYYGTVSAQSCVTQGSTIAVPIITGIESSEEGNSVTVSWWMDNCTAATYQNDIVFNVYVYKAGAATVVLQKIQVESTQRSLVIDGLASMTEYEFVVEAERKDLSAKETGSRTTAETAHRIIPDAPVNFTVEKGQSTQDIEISFELPSGAWYKENSGQSGFVLHPLYFKVFRKEADSGDDFKELLTFGAMRETPEAWKFEAKADLFFNCKTQEAKTKKDEDASAYLLVEPPVQVNAELLSPESPYDTYIPGTVIKFKDTTASRGKKYDYYIQSVTDDTPSGKIITADSSISEADSGWQIPGGIFSVKTVYEKNPENQNVFEKITFICKLNFQDFDTPYTYVIEESRIALDDTEELNPQKSLTVYNSLEEVNAAQFNFTQPSLAVGYYRYAIYICPASAGDAQTAVAQAYEQFTAKGKYLVTNDASSVPVITGFVLVDGYKDHFELSWEYNSDYTYIIHYSQILPDGTASEEETIEELAPDTECFDGKVTGDTVVYNHAAESGDRRIYKLEASVGLSEYASPNGDTEDKIYETLGTPEPEFKLYDYDRITVSWTAVQKAELSASSYEVKARYEEGEAGQNLVTDENTQITIEGQTITCVLNTPQGYNDAVLSGKPIEFTVTAKSSVTSDTSDAVIHVCTMGPALTEASVGTPQYDKINFSWKKVNGAKGYLIHRIRYTDGRCGAFADNGENTYYYDGENLIVDGNPVTSERAYIVTNDNLFILNDKYCDITDNTSPYQRNQSIINWGMPFGYIVVPVKEGGSESDFIFDGRGISLQTETPVDYTNTELVEKRGATFGYGFKVHAQKSMSSSKQTVTWEAPFYDDKIPSVYCREADEEGEWRRITDLDLSQGNQCAEFTPYDKNIAYEYFVAYNKSTSIISNDYLPASFTADSVYGLNMAETDYDYAALKQQNQNIQNENANKGYLLSVNYSARTGTLNEKSEIINWDEWDYSKRSIGPDSAVLYIRNYNISKDWIPLALIDSHMHYTAEAANLDNTKIEKNNNSDIEIKVMPKVLMDGTAANPVTAGLLQVLREAKHYYAMELTRGDESFMIGTDGSKYAYREISKKELVKCALLNIAYGFYLDAGGLDNLSNVNKKDLEYSAKTLTFNGTGSAVFGSRSLISALLWDSEVGKYKADVSMTDFAPLMLTPGGTSSCIVSVSFENVNTRTQGLSDAYLDKFRSENFKVTVKKIDTNMPDSYKGELTMTCTGTSNLVVKVDNESVVNISNAEERKRYFPIKFGSEEYFWGKEPVYGWWIEEPEEGN